MVSESCEKTWDPAWGSILFCYHGRLLKGWKSSLSPPVPLWQKFLFFPHPFGHNCAVFLWKHDKTIGIPTGNICWTCSRGARPRGQSIWQERASHRKLGYHQIIQNEHKTGTGAVSLPTGMRKRHFPRTRGDRREPGRFTHCDWKSGCEDPLARTEGARVEGMSDLTCFYFLLCLTLLLWILPIYKVSSSDYNEVYHFPTWVSKLFVRVHGRSRFTLGSATGHQPL